MKVAIVALIRDEAADILPWLGWYVRLGTDTLLLYDDASTDGTDRLITNAACLYDIRLHQLSPAKGSHVTRQKIIYEHALAHYGSEFDWIGFLDADEYLSLHNHRTIQDFLAQFSSDVGAVGINWCNYGSSGHVHKPPMPAFHAFTHHYAPERDINRHIKTFLRPKAHTGQWTNVHHFDVTPYRYVDPISRDISWGHLPGITATAPDWQGARIRHYQIRSMEHFVERAKRRKDITLTASNFTELDQNDSQDLSPRQTTPDIMDWVYRVQQHSLARTLSTLPHADPHTQPFTGPLRLSLLQSSDDNTLRLSGNTPTVMPPDSPAPPLLALQIGTTSQQVYLMSLTADGNFIPMQIEGSNTHSCLLPYELVPTNQSPLLALRQRDTHQFLSAAPLSVSGIVASDRTTVLEWETFTLLPIDQTELGKDILNSTALHFLQKALASPVSKASIGSAARQNMRLTLAILPLLQDAMNTQKAEPLL